MHSISLRNAAAIGNATSEMRRLGWSPHWTFDESAGCIVLYLQDGKNDATRRIGTTQLEFASFDLIWQECVTAMTELKKNST